ncbi:MAG: hypothetical protein ACERLG_12250 [Sedimentibacter sp.]
MSFIITVHVGEGIVMASDSRITYSRTENISNTVIRNFGVHSTNTTDKTFMCLNRCGISTCGEASINGQPITGFIQSFIRENVLEETNVSEIPHLLIDYFNSFNPVPKTNFNVAGYMKINDHMEQKMYKVNIFSKKIEDIATNSQGASWDGETLTLTKLLKPTFLKEKDDKYIELPNYEIPWNFFTLQDAINFAKFSVDVTINTMHYQNVVETVGGPIDILVIKPDETFWIQNKELHA